jgi:hypothetical protein
MESTPTDTTGLESWAVLLPFVCTTATIALFFSPWCALSLFFPPQSSTTTFLDDYVCEISFLIVFNHIFVFAITEQANGGRDEGEAKCRGAPIRAVFVHVRELLSVGNLRPPVS